MVILPKSDHYLSKSDSCIMNTNCNTIYLIITFIRVDCVLGWEVCRNISRLIFILCIIMHHMWSKLWMKKQNQNIIFRKLRKYSARLMYWWQDTNYQRKCIIMSSGRLIKFWSTDKQHWSYFIIWEHWGWISTNIFYILYDT